MKVAKCYRVIDGAITHPKRPHLSSRDNPPLGIGEPRQALAHSGATFPCHSGISRRAVRFAPLVWEDCGS